MICTGHTNILSEKYKLSVNWKTIGWHLLQSNTPIGQRLEDAALLDLERLLTSSTQLDHLVLPPNLHDVLLHTLLLGHLVHLLPLGRRKDHKPHPWLCQNLLPVAVLAAVTCHSVPGEAQRYHRHVLHPGGLDSQVSTGGLF